MVACSPIRGTAEFIERARAKHGDRFDYSVTRYTGYKSPVEVICRAHGLFKTVPKSHLHANSGGCTTCRQELITQALRNTTAQFIERAREIHGDRYDYSQVDYGGTRSKVTIVCPKHGPFRMRSYRHLGGRGCRKCTFTRIGRERRLSFWDFVERVITVHGPNRYEYELQDFVNMHSKIPIHCPKHGLFRQPVASHLKGTGCPKCIQSNGERRVREVLTTHGIDFSEQVRFTECRNKRPLPFDFFVASHRLLIEFDGHQHYDNSEAWGGEEKLTETQRHDAIKNRFAARNGYRLLRIPYWEYDNIDAILREQLAAKEEPVKGGT